MSENDRVRESGSIPGVKYRVIGLVSGGKDSTFNLLHCVANGHELVALATLTPELGIDELDSHLYQSVGTRILPLIAESMSLPLFTRCIKGKAVSRGPEYGSRHMSGEGSEVKGDETEDLYELLKQVKEAHPDVTALASGAILSNYQRLRIEHVCQRLGLVSISYLWQAEQLPLLEKMLECGMEVILVKVAGVGLGIDLVGQNLRDLMPLLRRLESRYGSHPAGEGGEYETLTLSTPLFSHRLELRDTEVVITDPEPYPVAYVRVGGGKLVKKEGWIRPGVMELRGMLGLGQVLDSDEMGTEGLGLDESAKELLLELRSVSTIHEREDRIPPLAVADAEEAGSREETETKTKGEGKVVQYRNRGRWFAVSISGMTRGDEEIGHELDRCFKSIQQKLETVGLSLPIHASHITLLLPSMSLFIPANKVYASYFGTSPPSRATVAVPLPQGTPEGSPEGGRVRLEVVGYDDRPLTSTSDTTSGSGSGSASGNVVGGRQALHVQGLSYWAPANIGPYSQAVIVNSRVALAGQIPLIPSSLTLPPPDYYLQSILALQHVGRIRDVLRSKSSTGGGWTGWVESCVGWWATSGNAAQEPGNEGNEGQVAGLAVVKAAWRLWAEREECTAAPVVFVQASELPKGALVEFQVNFHTGRPCVQELKQGDDGEAEEEDEDEDEDEDDEELEVVYSSSGQNSGISWELSTSDRKGQGSRAMVFVHDLTAKTLPDEISRVIDRCTSLKAYHTTSIPSSRLRAYLSDLLPGDACVTDIPVHSISSRHASCYIALEIFA